jgi:hypothetical protein
MSVTNGYCIQCERVAFRSPEDDPSCPVCSSPLNLCEELSADARSSIEAAGVSDDETAVVVTNRTGRV